MKFLLTTDLHYSDKPVDENNRYHGISLAKLKTAIENYSSGCEFIACLGDIVDCFEGCKSQEQGLIELGELIKNYPLPFYATFGNHDTAMEKRDFMRLAGMPDRYYSFETETHLCLMLDGCMNSKSEPYPQTEIVWTDCYIDGEQLCWLKEKLENSEKPVVIFSHIVLRPDTTDGLDEEERLYLDKHILNNSDEVTEILLANQEKIPAVFCGHYHTGLISKIGSIPFVIFKALCMGEAVTCAEVEITENGVKITGHGDEVSTEIRKG